MDAIQTVSLLRVPLETISQYFRIRQKAVERELNKLQADISALTTAADAGTWRHYASRLRELKTKLQYWTAQEAEAMASLKIRFAAIQDRLRLPFDLDVAIVEFICRKGYMHIAQQVFEKLPKSKQDMVDIAIFGEIEQCAWALKRRNLEPALRWSQEHASRLRRLNSPLEFWLRRAEFISLIAEGKLQDALAQASGQLAPAAKAVAAADGSSGKGVRAECMQQLQQVMSILAFPNPKTCGVPEVEVLFADEQWAELEGRFRRDAYKVIGCRDRPALEYMLLIGITALKTPSCTSSTTGTVGPYITRPATQHNGCPLCSPGYFGEIVAAAPMVRRAVSSLLCPISLEAMNDQNPPLALPNGHVYGTKTMELVTSEDKSKVFCPKTGDVFTSADVRRVFIL